VFSWMFCISKIVLIYPNKHNKYNIRGRGLEREREKKKREEIEREKKKREEERGD
jgi:hypothetical protein